MRQENVSNVWILLLDSSAARQITNFKSQVILYLNWLRTASNSWCCSKNSSSDMILVPTVEPLRPDDLVGDYAVAVEHSTVGLCTP